jgi:hypothetical protein
MNRSTLRSGPLSPLTFRSPLPVRGERVRVRGLRMTAIVGATVVLSLSACGTGDNTSPVTGISTSFQSPDDSTGGYVIATVPAGMGTPRATLYDGSNAQLASFVADAPGAGLTFWWTTAPNQTTRIAIHDDGGANYTYEVTPSYSQVADPYEPNDATDTATPMPDGAQMSAFLFAGRRPGASEAAAYDDYYRFTAQPGTVSIHLDNVPTDLAVRLFLLRADGTEVARVSNGMRGAPLAMTPPEVLETADFIVRVSLWTETPAAAAMGTDVPASFTQPYQLTVSQTQ